MIKFTKNLNILFETVVYTSDILVDYSNQFETLVQPKYLIVKKNGYYTLMTRREGNTTTDYTNIDDYINMTSKDTLTECKKYLQVRL